MKISKTKKSITFSNILKCLKKSRMKIAALIMALLTVTASFPAYALSSGSSTTVEEKWNNDINYNISGWTDDVKQAHSDILTDMEKHSKAPNFGGTVTLKGTGSGNSVTITDKNSIRQ